MKIDQLVNIPDLQTRLERYMEFQDGTVVRTTDNDLMILFDYDPVLSEDMLTKWTVKHSDSCTILSTFPLTVKVFGKDPHDIENRSMHMKRRHRMEYKIKKALERKEWDDL